MIDPASTVVLLGAGASKEAGVPTTYEMTQALVERVSRGQAIRDPTISALHFVCGALIAHDAATQGQSPYSGLDVERVFAAVELLAERDTLEVTPFVAAWHPAVDAWDTRDKSAPPFFDDKLQKALLDSPSFGRAASLITNLVDSRTGSAADGRTYRRLAGLMLTQLRELVATTPKDVGYLKPLAEASKVGGLTIATLNYDLAIEQVAEVEEAYCSTGIEGWLDSGRWEWPEHGIRLLKLHGSIDWNWAKGDLEPGHLPQRLLNVTGGGANDRGAPAVVFGNRGKLRAEGPFLSLLGELETLMSRAEHLVVVGYSFRDDHVNELVRRWASEDIQRRITVVDPYWPDRLPSARSQDFRGLMARHLVPRKQNFRPRLEIVKASCAAALPDLFS